MARVRNMLNLQQVVDWEARDTLPVLGLEKRIKSEVGRV